MSIEKEWRRLHFFHRIYYREKIKLLKKKLKSCGDRVSMPHSTRILGENLSLGNDVYLGEDGIYMCTNAPIIIGDHVMFGPRVTMISGDHRTNIKGRYMTDITDEDKLPENDLPIILEGDNWIGANVTILKGVTIGEGAIIAAGSVVIRNIPAYSIAGGVPAKVIKYRFTKQEIEEHKILLGQNMDKKQELLP